MIRVGRALGNDVILDDRHISRRHAQLRWRAGTYHLSDMGSSLGTTLNGRPIGLDEAVPLAGGDEISLAGIVLAVHVGSAPSEGDV